MAMDSFRDGIQMRMRIMKEATGMVFMVVVKGVKRVLKVLYFLLRKDVMVPRSMPRRKPRRTWERERRMDL